MCAGRPAGAGMPDAGAGYRAPGAGRRSGEPDTESRTPGEPDAGRREPATVAAMPPRRLDPRRLLAAVNEQRAELGDAAWAGPLTADALADGCLAAVAAALDAGLPPCREALRAAVMRLLDLLAARAPGRAVEVRVPPFAAIQCVEGPRHTRGTPPNVVETDAVTWISLATGRLAWASAVAGGRIQASGPRADLAAYLPLQRAGSGHRRTGRPESID